MLDQLIVAAEFQAIVQEVPEPLQRMEAVGGGEAETKTVTLWKSLPPGPVQFRLYTFVPVRLPVDCEPDIALLPDQSPLAVQAVAFVVDQESVAAVFHAMVQEPGVPLQSRVRLGAGGAFTVMVLRASAAGAVPRSTMTLPVYVPAEA